MFLELPQTGKRRTTMAADTDMQAGETVVLPLHGETASVSAQPHETGRVQIETITRLRHETVNTVLHSEHVEISHVPIGIFVDSAPPVREQGDLTIVPVIEEVLVVERRLRVREELHIRRIRTPKHHAETVQLREQHAVITRVPARPHAEETTATPTHEESET